VCTGILLVPNNTLAGIAQDFREEFKCIHRFFFRLRKGDIYKVLDLS